MPRVRGYTVAQKTEAARSAERRRIEEIVYRYLGRRRLTELAEMAGVNYDVLQRKVGGITRWDVHTLIAVCDALGVSAEDRGKMLGAAK